MSFSTENRKISDIFQRSSVYKVPRYQRDYVWKEINWKELLIDINFTLNNFEDVPWSHFLGTIVLNKIDYEDNGLDIYEIIDGQQRLMTIYVILITLYKNFKQKKEDIAIKRADYIFETFLTSLTKESKRELILKNELYDDEIKTIIDSSHNNVKLNGENKLFPLFNYFNNEFKSKDFDELDRFLNKLLSINVVEIISDEDEEIYNIFEVLNARGQKLKQIELLKNHIMKYIQPRENEFIDQAKIKWRKIVDNISHLNDPDLLIQHFSKCYIEKKAENQNSIYRLIKEEVDIKDLNTFLEELLDFSEVYKDVSDKNSEDTVIKYFNIKRNQQIRSLLCAIYSLSEKDIISKETKESSLIQIRNFFFLFNTTQQTSNRTDKLISSISYDVYHCKEEVEFKIIFTDFLYKLNTYLEGKEVKSMFVSNQTFRYSNKDKNLKRNGSLVKYILILLYEANQNDSTIIANDMTIEHLTSDDGTSKTSPIWNLTLTNSDINSRLLQDKCIKEKIDILNEESSIKENRNLKCYLEKNEFNFEKREEDMLKILFEKIFKLNLKVFNISDEDISEYKQNEKIIKEHPELKKLLKKYGNKFEIKINNDPKLIKEREQFISLKN